MRFFKCMLCGKLIEYITETDRPTICCGRDMIELLPNTSDGDTEKHVPVIKCHENTITVTIGENPHPMTEHHYIEWIAIETKMGYQRRSLSPGDEPKVCFATIEGDEIVAAYAYCNLHGLWLKTGNC